MMIITIQTMLCVCIIPLCLVCLESEWMYRATQMKLQIISQMMTDDGICTLLIESKPRKNKMILKNTISWAFWVLLFKGCGFFCYNLYLPHD